jgi:drug/metabolite transporter (DMT)-like permease
VDSFIVAAVLFGALLHASWNALVKSSGDKPLDIALVHLLGAVAAAPLLLWAGLPPVAAWPYVGASLLIHVAYYVTLNGAYQHGDLGVTYPVMRGSAPMLASLGSYRIALWAMTRAPVAAVSALRETSVLFATVLSVAVLKERFGLQRLAGAAVVVGGVVALRLS